jgi:hypothetical protein
LQLKKLKKLRKRKKTPIFVGGTGLYFKALTDGLVSIPNIPIRFRNKIRTLHKSLGQKKFYQKLIKLDPNSKKKLIQLMLKDQLELMKLNNLLKNHFMIGLKTLNHILIKMIFIKSILIIHVKN